MAVIACGINHKTAPLSVRETLAQREADGTAGHQAVFAYGGLQGLVCLSTCNRTEWYAETDTPHLMLSWFAKAHAVSTESIAGAWYCHTESNAMRHILRVATGVDSMMLGEPQILGQMKHAYQTADTNHSLSPKLRQLFAYVFAASKRVRHQSGISNNPISVASAAARLVGQHLGTYATLHAFIIGAGETAALVAKYLKQHGVHRFTVVSRTEQNARLLAETLNGSAYLTINDIPNHLPHADVVISATACPLPFITQTMVRNALEQRSNKPMFFIDLAVPRDIEPNIAELQAVHLVNLDDLHHCIEQSLQERRRAADCAEALIETEMVAYARWSRTLTAKQAICDYRHQMQTLAEYELQRATKKLASGHTTNAVLTEFCTRLLNKLTHAPTIRLREAAANQPDEWINTSTARLTFQQDSHEEIT